MTEFHQHINSVCHHIQFTMEEEQDLSLPFLDVLVIQHDKTLRTQVYRKPTHTDRILHFDSHHPQRQKLAVTKTSHDRANTHNTIPADARHEITHVLSVLQLNGFPLRHSYPIPKVKLRTQHSILSTSPPYLMYRVLQNVSVVFLTKLVWKLRWSRLKPLITFLPHPKILLQSIKRVD